MDKNDSNVYGGGAWAPGATKKQRRADREPATAPEGVQSRTRTSKAAARLLRRGSPTFRALEEVSDLIGVPAAQVLDIMCRVDRCRFEVTESHGVQWVRCPPRHERYKKIFGEKKTADDDENNTRRDGAPGSSADVVADQVEVEELAPAVAGTAAAQPPWRVPQPPPAAAVTAAELYIIKSHRAEVLRGRVSGPAKDRLPVGISPEGQELHRSVEERKATRPGTKASMGRPSAVRTSRSRSRRIFGPSQLGC